MIMSPWLYGTENLLAAWGTTPYRGQRGGRLAEKDPRQTEELGLLKGTAYNRGSTEERLVLPALYGGSSDETHQIMLFLSAADGLISVVRWRLQVEGRQDEVQYDPP